MLPLAIILKGLGHEIAGSDRSFDQGRTPEKFAWISAQGIQLFPQNGSGIADDLDAVIISKAVEETVPDMIAAKQKGVPIRLRVDMLIESFNAAPRKIAIAGTSGKTTTTGMTGFIFRELGQDPTIMNGGIFRNYAKENPYSTAFVGKGNAFITEVDESDGEEWTSRYRPDIAILHNIALDHDGMDSLRHLFTAFLSHAKTAVLNIDHPEVLNLMSAFQGKIVTYGFTPSADFYASDVVEEQFSIAATLHALGQVYKVRLMIPGRHNLSNALAALAATHAAGVDIAAAVECLSRFRGIKRRMEVVGEKKGIIVIDDFAHNPDKIAATLSTLKHFPARLIVFFQPHGYKFLTLVRQELADVFAAGMDAQDVLFMVEPLYMGGSVDRSVTSADVARIIKAQGGHCDVLEDRDAVRAAILKTVQKGDRIIIMGARDDTLSTFATDILSAL